MVCSSVKEVLATAYDLGLPKSWAEFIELLALLKDFKFKQGEEIWGWKSDKDLTFVVKEVREDLRRASYPPQGGALSRWPIHFNQFVLPYLHSTQILANASPLQVHE
ncbi:hypothetical protein L1987_14597 [Smallanthus sonchifolius]|uniref:Uncharacterized protein n=1 Tax=Smallanthus sonchifolius TaxID=185202 RepID=A0ACB9J4T4_9ASTR|nr:hypothetical protein L1987_14597 [Smallanthus sonchifolius]